MSKVICLLTALSAGAAGHGTIVNPAMRSNPHVERGWCPWCQGSASECVKTAAQDEEVARCRPKLPCWGARSAETVSPDKFIYLGRALHPDGSFWVDQSGGTAEPPLWCPGDILPIRYYIHSDHNGVWFWESQLAGPGNEVEANFARITNYTSINNYNQLRLSNGTYQKVMLANYFRSEDGVTEIKGGTCKDGKNWSVDADQCMNEMFAETKLELPIDLPPGETVLRWRWFGASDAEGHVVKTSAAERSLFVSCKDVIIGTPEQCSARGMLLTV